MSIQADQVTRYKIEGLVKPKNGIFRILIDYYWVVDNDGNVLKFKDRVWQCNRSEYVVKSLQNSVYTDCTVKQIPIMYLEWND